MKVEIIKDEYGIQISTDKENQDHVIELNSIGELIYMNRVIDNYLETYNKQPPTRSVPKQEAWWKPLWRQLNK